MGNKASPPDGAALTFRPAKPEDVPAAQELYARIRQYLTEHDDYARWHKYEHPKDSAVQVWAEEGVLYVVLDGETLVGAVALDHDAAPGYERVDWQIQVPTEEALIVHSLGVHPDHMGKGIARLIVDQMVEVARGLDAKTIRLDTFYGNWPAHSLYTATGFSHRGVHGLDYPGIDIDKYHVFEKLV